MGRINITTKRTKEQLEEHNRVKKQIRKINEEMHAASADNIRLLNDINNKAKKNRQENNLPPIPGFLDSRLGKLISSMGSSKMTSDEAVKDLSMLEFVIVNSYLIKLSDEAQDGFKVNYGGQTESGRLYFSNLTNSSIYKGYWMSLTVEEFPEFNFIVQTLAFQDSYGRMNYQLSLISDDALPGKSVEVIRDDIFDMSFKKSEYVGKCLRVNVDEGRLNKVEIVNTDTFKTNLILDKTQTNFLNKFGDIVAGGGNARYLLNGVPGCGKAQPLTAKILTPSGWTTMGEIKIGDEVITPMGKISSVVGVYPQGEKEIFSITFKDGKTTECCGEHLWKVCGFKKGNRKSKKSEWHVLDTLYLKNKLENTKDKIKIQLVEPSINDNIVDVDYIIDPYLMGLLLGDGSFGDSFIALSTSDEEILDSVKSLIPIEYNLVHDSKYDYIITRKEGKGYKVGDNGNLLVREINDLGLKRKKSENKFIPEKYKRGSLKQKMALLQGLFDSDGTAGTKGSISYSTSSEELAKDVQELIWSIGGLASITSRIPKFTHKGIKKSGLLAYRVNVRMNNREDLFRLSRKKERVSGYYQYRSFLKNEIISITSVGFKEAQCIMIDDKEHLYITDNYVVTHNTQSIRNIIAEYTPTITFVQPEFTTSDDLMSIMESCEVFAPCVIIIDDIDLYLGSRDKGSYSNLLGKFLSYFDGVKKRNVSLLASTNDQSLVDSAAQRPGRFNMILDFGYLSQENIIEVCKLVLPKKFQVDEVYNVLSSNNKKISGAFLANLGENLKEFSSLDKKWTLEDTKALIQTSYDGFYSSQLNTKAKLGFHIRE